MSVYMHLAVFLLCDEVITAVVLSPCRVTPGLPGPGGRRAREEYG